MTYPNEFYYHEKRSEGSFKRSPPGSLHVPRLIKTKPCWQSPNLISEKKQRTLILTDYTTSKWSSDKIETVLKKLHQLIKDEFKIYIWQDREIIPFTEEHLKSEKIQENITRAFPSDIYQIASKSEFHLQRDQIHLLDDYWIGHLVSEEEKLQPRQLYSRQVTHLSDDELTEVINISKQSTPPLHNLCLESFEYSNVQAIKTASALSAKEFIINVKLLKLTLLSIISLVKSGYLTEDDTRYDISRLSSVEDFALEDTYYLRQENLKEDELIIVTQFLGLLSNIKNIIFSSLYLTQFHSTTLKRLTIIHHADQSASKLDFNLPALETLTIQGRHHGYGEEVTDQLSLTEINKILAHTPNLKTLQLMFVKIVDDSSDNFVSNCQTISFQYCIFNLSILQKIVTQSPQLTTLSIQHPQIEGAISKKLSLTQLTAVSLRHITISSTDLDMLFSSSQAVEKLVLDNTAIKGDVLNISFPKLTLLSVESEAITFNIKKQLLKAPDLKQLFINHIDSSNMLKLFPTALKVVFFRDSEIEFNKFGKWLNCNTHLNSLYLTNCNFTGTIEIDLQLPSLEHISINGLCHKEKLPGAPNDIIHKLIKSSPNLKSISLNHCTLEGKISEDCNLSQLNDLTLQSINLDNNTLSCWLQRARALENLIIGVGIHLHDQHYENIKLPNLKSAAIGSSISLMNLHHLLCASQRLSELTVELRHGGEESRQGYFNLPELKYLGVTRTCEPEDLSLLLFNSHKIRELSLRENYFVENSDFPLLDLASAKKITNSGGYFSKKNFNRLVACAPNANVYNIPIWEECIERRREAQRYLSRMLDKHETNTPTKQITARDPTHNIKKHFQAETKTDTPAETQFQYTGENKTHNQAMIIENLSQYLVLTKQDEAIIPIIQKGICHALSYFFRDKTEKQWNEFIASLLKWDGELKTIDSKLRTLFSELLSYVKRYQLSGSGKLTFIGNNFLSFLKSHKSKLILCTPWHAVVIKYQLFGKGWVFYDPNFVKGPKVVPLAQLPELIEKYIGRVVSIEGDTRIADFSFDANEFIAYGGLINLSRQLNFDIILTQLKQQATVISKKALDGILLQSTEGEPAWFRMISNSCATDVILCLLNEFFKKNSNTAHAKLEKSLAAVSVKDRTRCATFLNKLKIPAYSKTFNDICYIINKRVYIEKYEKSLTTWQDTTKDALTLTAYLQHLTGFSQKKLLVKLSSQPFIQAMSLALEAHCLTANDPVYYIDSPDELSCSAPYVKREDSNGDLTLGPGGPLFDFIKANQNKRYFLIINFDSFEADDIVQHNAILDTQQRYADGVLLPNSAVIIGLINPTKPGCYQGEDFYSRFDRVETPNLNHDELLKVLTPFDPHLADNAKHTPIKLYHSANWEDRLLGRWIVKDGKRLFYKEGKLVPALQAGLPLCIMNGLWHDRKFNLFWRQAQLRHEIQYEGRTIKLPSPLELTIKDGYDFSSVSRIMRVEPGITSGAPALNPTEMSRLFEQYECDNGKKSLRYLTGYIESAKNKTLHVNVTRNLDEDDWSMILDACEEHHVKLTAHFAPSVTLPNSLKNEFKLEEIKPVSKPWIRSVIENTMVIASTDIDTTMAMTGATAKRGWFKSLFSESKESDWLILDVSECEAEDLLIRINGNLNSQEVALEFHSNDGAIPHAFRAGKNILLKGTFSQTLVDSLANLLTGRHAQPQRNKLILITENATQFNYMPVHTHIVTKDEKRSLLNHDYTFSDVQLATESLAQLQARQIYLKNNPGKSSDENWKGLNDLPISLVMKQAIDLANAEQISNAFIKERMEAIQKILHYSPYVFLTGLTGVGKSTFIEKYFKQFNIAFYQGETALREWATDNSPKQKILFIDEANLDKRQWSEFEGLYNTPPTILIDGKPFTLTENHKVIFAGNPVSYGDERKLAPLFKRHGNAVAFDLMPPEFIYMHILKPVFLGGALESANLNISEQILKFYQFFCEISHDKVLISPRDLQMIALLILTHQKRNPSADVSLTTQYYLFLIGRTLVPPHQRTSFNDQFPEPVISHAKEEFKSDPSYLITPSRIPTYRHLSDLIDLRHFRRHEAVNDEQKYGGLNGFVLEGDSATGKSKLILSALSAHGFQEVYRNSTVIPERAFYRIPVTMSVEDKTAILLKAFFEGAVVVIDEINSSPMMERLLNALLMGETPEGKRPSKPGFMIIGTQNDISKDGRRKPSPALARRMTTMELPPYTHDEMCEILVHKGLPPFKTECLVTAFETQLKKAEAMHLTPKPTFRDLEREAENEITAKPRLIT